jgi:hypothetical protein
MTHRLTLLFFTLILLLTFERSVMKAQDDFQRKMIEAARKSEQEKATRTENDNKLSGGLLGLLRLAEQADNSPIKKTELENRLRRNSHYNTDSLNRIRVCINFRSNAADEIATTIKNLGGQVEVVGSTFIYCYVRPQSLRPLSTNDAVTLIKLIYPGRNNTIISAGDSQLKTDSVRLRYAVSGFGQRVGVLSDGIRHISNVQSGGELPAVTNLDTLGLLGNGDEGTAMLEIVHDLAPSADLFFRSSLGGYEYFAYSIVRLSTYCNIIVDDVTFFDEPFFSDEDPQLGAAIRQFLGRGGVYISSAGNFNYDPSTLDGRRLYSGTTSFNANNFHVFPDSRTYIEVEMPPFGHAEVFLQWSTRWNTPTADYDLYIFDESGNEILADGGGRLRQGNFVPPREIVGEIFNPSDSTKLFRIAIRRYSGDLVSDFKIFCQEDFPTVGHTYLRNATTDRKHIYGHKGYPGVIAVAAYHADLPGQMASYSSWGDLRMFSADLNQWTIQRTPVVTATSKVHTYVGQILHHFDDPFEGTSAAAPHIAGIAALYFSQFPTRTRTDFINDLTSTASVIDGEGGNGRWSRRGGYGKANALAAFNSLNRVATPAISPRSGTFDGRVRVTMSCTTPGASIYYRLGGADPDSTSLFFSGEFDISSSSIVKAKAYKSGMPSSNVDSVQYIVNSSGIPMPQFSVPSGTYVGQVRFRILANYNSGNFVIYTDNGEEPDLTNPNIHYVFFDQPFTFGPGTRTYKAKQVISDSARYRTSQAAVVTYSVLPGLRIAQVDTAGFSFGMWRKWETSGWSPYPDTTFLRPVSSATYSVHADTNFKPSTTQKYNVWTKGTSTNYFINHADVQVDPGTENENVQAHFKYSKPATIQAQLIEGGTIGGTINFKDPWLIDDADSKGPKNRGVNAIFHNNIPSPFKPESSATYKGVFLSQDYNIPGNPYYTVGAPLQQTFGGRTANFTLWSGSNVAFRSFEKDTSAVVFQQPGATATALYKLPLASNASAVLGSNQQRKLSRWRSNVISSLNGYNLFYESGNQIWHTTSTNMGASWLPEKLVSTNAGVHKSPSIALGRIISGVPSDNDIVWHTTTSTANQIWYSRGGSSPSLVSNFTRILLFRRRPSLRTEMQLTTSCSLLTMQRTASRS